MRLPILHAGSRLAGALTEARAQVVDSILPPEIELARFRRTIPGPAPRALAGPTSRVALIQGFLSRLEARDTAGLGDLLLSKAEFAYLYFPNSEYARPPYRQDPALVWFRMANTSETGLRRLLDRDGGSPLRYAGYRCPSSPVSVGSARIWKGCVVKVSREGRAAERRLFGSIIERDGRYKFITYATEY